jgi:hypothetical protein
VEEGQEVRRSAPRLVARQLVVRSLAAGAADVVALQLVARSLAAGAAGSAAGVPEAADVVVQSAAIVDAAPADAVEAAAEHSRAALVAAGW